MGHTITALERFFKKVKLSKKCWIWTGGHHLSGYGVFNTGKRLIGSHRWIYEFVNGKIKQGLEIDHLCRRPACVRPSHLEAVSHSLNVKRGTCWHHLKQKASLITHCPRGHKYSKENTYIHRNCRQCKECVRRRSREYQARKRQAIAKAEEE